ncbi:MAG: DUF1566 domain-containing protein [Deltaproteobacteria bacterium]|jgi:hypothetical protein|nr:DUF1566 domain-containing protein [Deltaproteobacteria bacterium]MBT4263056.1 DUF1566 domain-containing protein [Deltaproteobacteria bacterium]MBT4643407.1 DUF1566 domain-containing protein [Deltaproteobacteria bacterium]MBT6502657.1 DUF1566 domain-containing protein [Deltaproteobacteria bacterium]MBT6613342.1 DUF1566 domain-containing protein [Deltaproteobacteria bacterium]
MKKQIVGFYVIGLFFLIATGHLPAADYSDNGDSTVTQNTTGLVWQQLEGGSHTWEAALAYCETLVLGGNSDWRLPNHKELHSLIDYSDTSPPVIDSLFSSANSNYYWTSTTKSNDLDMAWLGYFNTGGIFTSSKTNSYPVRCVRGGL